MKFIIASVVFFALNASTFASSNGQSQRTNLRCLNERQRENSCTIDDFSAFYNALVGETARHVSLAVLPGC